jgi:hypothetical protein
VAIGKALEEKLGERRGRPEMCPNLDTFQSQGAEEVTSNLACKFSTSVVANRRRVVGQQRNLP